MSLVLVVLLSVLALQIALLCHTVYAGTSQSTSAALILDWVKHIYHKETNIMAELEDLTQAISDENATIVELATDIDNALARLAVPGIAPSDVEAAAKAIQAANATLKASAKNIEDALNPPATVVTEPVTGV